MLKPLAIIALLALTILPGPATAGPLEYVTSVPLVRARQVDFQGDHAWVAQNMDGAALIDIRNPDNPALIRQFSPDHMQPLFLRTLPDENLLLSADRFRGLVIYDVSTPDTPTTVSVLPLERMTTHLGITRTTDGMRLAILARAGDGLLSVDITNPAAPRITDTFTTGIELTRAVAIRDNIVYAADSTDGGLKALRIVSPGIFEPLYQANLSGKCQSLAIRADLLIAGYAIHGFRIFRLPDPDLARHTSQPLTLLSTTLRNRSRTGPIDTSGSLILTANSQMGIDLYDAKDPAMPDLYDEILFHTPGTQAQSCRFYRNEIYIPAWDDGLLIYRLTNAPRPSHFNLENL